MVSKKSERKVSVIFRTKSLPESLYKSIESLNGQECEIIVVHNGSPVSHDFFYYCVTNGIRYFHRKEGNASKAFNIGTILAEGNIIVCADDDAWFHKDYVKEVKKHAEKGFIKTGAWVIDDFGEKDIAWNQACFCFKDDYLEFGGHDVSFSRPNATDVAFSLRAKEAGMKIKHIPQPIYYHPATGHKRGFHVGVAEARASKKYSGYLKVWRMIGSDMKEIWRIVRHTTGLIYGRLL